MASAGACLAAETGAGDWPHWRGEHRGDVVDEPSGWSADGWSPAVRWRTNVGEGASSPLVVAGRLYALGWRDGGEVVSCLDVVDGRVVWEQRYPAPRHGRHAVGDQGFYRGATPTPEFDAASGLLFTLGSDGTLSAWDTDADTGDGGRKCWQVNLYDRFNVPRRPQVTEKHGTLRDYGYTCAPRVHGDWLLVEVGDPARGNLMAFAKATGDPVWASENRDPAGHTGGIAVMDVEGVPCAAVATAFGVHVARLDAGRAGQQVAHFPWRTDFANTIASVATEGNAFLVTSRYNQAAMAKVEVSLDAGAREVWRSPHPSGVCTPVIHRGRVYTANHGVSCLDFETGRRRWDGGRIGDAGSCIVTSDERLLVWGNGGDLLLVEGDARAGGQYVELAARRRLLDDMAWPHVVLAGRSLYLRTVNGDLLALALEGGGVGEGTAEPAPPAGTPDPRGRRRPAVPRGGAPPSGR